MKPQTQEVPVEELMRGGALEAQRLRLGKKDWEFFKKLSEELDRVARDDSFYVPESDGETVVVQWVISRMTKYSKISSYKMPGNDERQVMHKVLFWSPNSGREEHILVAFDKKKEHRPAIIPPGIFVDKEIGSMSPQSIKRS
jgi:hypothetical protein